MENELSGHGGRTVEGTRPLQQQLAGVTARRNAATSEDTVNETAKSEAQHEHPPHAYLCDACYAIRPLVIVDMHADDASGAYTEASDLRCDFCGFVIATLYVPKPKTQAIEALRRKA